MTRNRGRIHGSVRFVAALVYVLAVGWLIALIGYGAAALYAIGDYPTRLLLGRELRFGRAWARAAYCWFVLLVKWIAFGHPDDPFPGWYPTPRRHG